MERMYPILSSWPCVDCDYGRILQPKGLLQSERLRNVSGRCVPCSFNSSLYLGDLDSTDVYIIWYIALC